MLAKNWVTKIFLGGRGWSVEKKMLKGEVAKDFYGRVTNYFWAWGKFFVGLDSKKFWGCDFEGV